MDMHLIIITAAQILASLSNVDPNIAPQVAAKRIADCGVGAVTVRSDAGLDGDVLIVGGSAPLSDQQLVCINKAADFYDVELPSSAQHRFNAIREAHSVASMTSEARKWLKAHDLLDQMPKYEAGVTDDAAFRHEVDKLCRADGALRSSYDPHTLSSAWIIQHVSDAGLEDGPLACLLNVARATGFKMSFIGNKQAVPK